MDDQWTRLKQRKRVSWALASVAFSFVLLQDIDIVALRFAMPDSAQSAIALALALGCFVTLLLAWYHGEQGRQRVSGTELLLIALPGSAWSAVERAGTYRGIQRGHRHASQQNDVGSSCSRRGLSRGTLT